MANKIVVQAVQGTRQDGLVAQYVVLGAEREPLTAGSIVLNISHAGKVREIFDMMESVVHEILDQQGYINKPDISVVGGKITG